MKSLRLLEKREGRLHFWKMKNYQIGPKALSGYEVYFILIKCYYYYNMKRVLLTRKNICKMEDLIRLKNDPMWNQGYTKNVYGFPLPNDRDFLESGSNLAIGNPEDETYRIGPYYAAKSPQSHISPFKWAIDFLVPDGTEILATEDGKIVEVEESFNEWGGEEFRNKLNYLTLLHDNGEYSQYCHLTQNSFSKTGLKVGDLVKKGQQIATVGKTGWTDRDHLHFVVLKFAKLIGSPWPYYSLEIQFEKK